MRGISFNNTSQCNKGIGFLDTIIPIAVDGKRDFYSAGHFHQGIIYLFFIQNFFGPVEQFLHHMPVPCRVQQYNKGTRRYAGAFDIKNFFGRLCHYFITPNFARCLSISPLTAALLVGYFSCTCVYKSIASLFFPNDSA